MTDLGFVSAQQLSSLVDATGQAGVPFLDLFAAQIHNVHTRRAYRKAVQEFLTWGASAGVSSICEVDHQHVAAWVESLAHTQAAGTIKQRLAAVRQLFDWLMIGQFISVNPTASVRGPSHPPKRGKAPVLEAAEARQLLDSIDASTQIGLRDRALIAMMLYSFARVGSVLAMRVEDVYVRDRCLWVRRQEKGGRQHEMPCHPKLGEYLNAYIDGCGIGRDTEGALFRSIGRGTGEISDRPLQQSNAWAIVKRRRQDAGIPTCIGNHSLRATGITVYLSNGGSLEMAATMANHASIRTTQLYGRGSGDVTLDDVERVQL